jgi:chromate transport protein ChrA
VIQRIVATTDAESLSHPSSGLTDDALRPEAAHQHGVSFAQALRVWLRIAALSFGGPAGQIAVMHRIVVDEKQWIGEDRFLHALSYCTLLPGPEAQQFAIYIGWLMHRTRGGIAAGTLFVLPGAVSILALSYVYAGWGQFGAVVALFLGLKSAVLAVVLQAGGRLQGAQEPGAGRHRRCLLRCHLLLRRAIPVDHPRGWLGRLGRQARELSAVPGRRRQRGRQGKRGWRKQTACWARRCPIMPEQPSRGRDAPPLSGSSCGFCRCWCCR